VGQAGDSAVDIGLIVAATTGEPGVASWLLWKALAWLGVAAGLTFVIFVHELGHFLVAKACGVKCEKFYVGFDFFEFRIPFTKWKVPRSLVKFQWGETEYGIGSLPLGGYVKMLGQDDDPRNAETEAARIRSEAIADPSGPPPQTPEEAPVPAQTVEGKTVLLDPRSYPAKSVPARMAIISAGVIMNLIFGVILAAIAFSGGVRELPATIGAVTPGSPAWTAGIVPGSKILQVGRHGAPYEHLRFEDLTTSVVLNGYERDLPILIRRPDGQEVWYELRPSDRLKPITKRPTLGVVHEASGQVRVHRAPADYLNPITAPALADKDKVVAIDGQTLEAGWDIAAILARKPAGAVTLTVERFMGDDKSAEKRTETLTISVPERPMRDIGAAMQIGPIVAVRKGSPAEEAGFQVKDQIIEINGEPAGDALSLPQRLVQLGASLDPIKFTVSRTDRQGAESKRTLTVKPEQPLQFNDDFPLGGPTAIESIGVAYTVTHTVAAVDPAGPAASAGLVAGDVVTHVEFVPAGEKQREREREILPSDAFKPIALDDNLKSWTYVFTRLQLSLPDTKIKLTWTHDGREMSATLDNADSTTFFDESRGLSFYGDWYPHIADGPGDALRLGFRETKERLREVVLILHSLVTGRISPTNLSGAPGIFVAAASFASEGPSKLLIFLTMLSANLAVLNFLPIPALDGGHMLFLAAEGIRGKPVDERLQIRLTIAGVICLLSLMVFATAMDIGRFAEMIQEWFG
jgi:regulator of sigma E protease